MPNINLKAQNPTRIQEGMKELGESLVADLSDHINIPVSTVSVVLAELYRRRMVHISGWGRNKQGRLLKIYAWGEGHDAKQPIKTTKAKEAVQEVQLPFPRCDIAASWLTHLMAQS